MDSSPALVVRSGPEEDDGDGLGGETRTQKDLTEDDILEILARLPVKSLLRFRCISKHWYNLILSPNFISMHTHHRNNKNVTLRLSSCCQILVGMRSETVLTFRFGQDDDLSQELRFNHSSSMEVTGSAKIVGCFNGVVCLNLSTRPPMYALWNPATRKVREIRDSPMVGPYPSHLHCPNGSYCSGFCFDPVNKSFMVIQIQLTITGAARDEARALVTVFSTATNSWTETKNISVPYPIGARGSSLIQSATCVNGYLHCHIVIYWRGGPHLRRVSVGDVYILSYDIINEVFQRIEMPSPRHEFAQYRLASYRGSLAMFVSQVSSSVIDVWVMNDCGGGSGPSWSKILTCKPSIDVSYVVGFFRKDDVDLILLHARPRNSPYVYDPVSGETKEFRESKSILETFPYSETLASLN